MSLIRIIVFAIFFYLIFKAVKYLIALVGKSSDQGTNVEGKGRENKRMDIKKEDIIEADFEEIDESESDKNK